MTEYNDLPNLLNGLFPATLVRETAPGVYDHVFQMIGDAANEAAISIEKVVLDLSAAHGIEMHAACIALSRSLLFISNKKRSNSNFSKARMNTARKHIPNTLWCVK